MSEDDSADSYIFVQMLSKYKVLLERLQTPELIRKKNVAAHRMAEEFSRKRGKKLTMRQVFKKIYDIKQRLKRRNCRNLMSDRKHTPYLKWERMFLELWVGNGISVSKNKSPRNLLPVEEPPKHKTPEEIIRNFEADYNLLEDDTHTLSESSSDNCEPEPKSAEPLNVVNDEKRAALISQIKLLKTQAAVARTEENTYLYKLSALQQNCIVKSEH